MHYVDILLRKAYIIIEMAIEMTALATLYEEYLGFRKIRVWQRGIALVDEVSRHLFTCEGPHQEAGVKVIHSALNMTSVGREQVNRRARQQPDVRRSQCEIRPGVHGAKTR